MTADFEKTVRKNVPIHALTPVPGVILWYCRISGIIRHVFTTGIPEHFRTQKQRIFEPNSFTFPFVTDTEIRRVNEFKSLKKQIEWLCGRFLLKELAMHCLDLEEAARPRLAIAYEDQGAPYLESFPDRCITLSHSGDITCAAMSLTNNLHIGVDAEQIDNLPGSGFLKTAFTPRERMDLPADARGIYRHWTAKEAFLKWIRKGFNESLHRVEVTKGKIRYNQTTQDVRLFSFHEPDRYVISLVIGYRAQ